jgi:hypothetical protein
MLRASAAGLLVGLACLATGCAVPADDADGAEVASEDAALAALEQRIGFDGAVLALDEAALARVDASAKRLEARGEGAEALEAHATRAVLVEARARPGAGASVGVRSLEGLYDTDLLRLNGQERALCKGARMACVRVLLAGLAARTASQGAYRDGNVGGRIDAFRHTSWNALMVRWTDARTAKAWADAHENGYPENRASRRARVLSDMDFFNNDVGRRLGARLPEEAGLAEITEAVRGSLEQGELRAIRYDLGDADGVLVSSQECSDRVRCGT